MVFDITHILKFLSPLNRLVIKKISGVENIPERDNFIVVSNHEHYIDPVYVYYPLLKKLNRKIYFVASPRYWPYLGKKICEEWAGCIPAYEGKTYDVAKEALLSKKTLCIFPEGHLRDIIRIPKTGAVRLALETKVPILPMGIKSSYVPFTSRINIGKLIYITDKKNIENDMLNLMNEIYKLKNES